MEIRRWPHTRKIHRSRRLLSGAGCESFGTLAVICVDEQPFGRLDCVSSSLTLARVVVAARQLSPGHVLDWGLEVVGWYHSYLGWFEYRGPRHFFDSPVYRLAEPLAEAQDQTQVAFADLARQAYYLRLRE